MTDLFSYQFKHVFWVLKRIVLDETIHSVTTTYVFVEKMRKISFRCGQDIYTVYFYSFLGGVFLTITTIYAQSGSAFVTPSAAAKAGVECLVK